MKDKRLLVTIILLIVFACFGILNTFYLETEEFGSYRHYLGMGAFLLAIIECIILIKKLFPGKSRI